MNDTHLNSSEESQDSISLIVPDQTVQVKTAVTEESIFTKKIHCNGKIKAAKEEVWKGSASSKVIRLNGTNGTRFSKGQLIAELDSREIKLNIERAELKRFNAERNYKSELIGYREIMKDQDRLQQDSIIKKLKIASGLAELEIELKEQAINLENALIHAPFDGMLAGLKIHPGQVVNEGEELFLLYDDKRLLIQAKAVENDAAVLKAGMSADVFMNGFDHTLKAIIQSINPYIEENGAFTIVLELLPFSKQRIFPGMACDVYINIPKYKSLIIPKAALVKRQDKQVVFTANNGMAKWNDVKVDADNGTEVSILSGIRKGDRVIISNNAYLDHNSPIKPEN